MPVNRTESVNGDEKPYWARRDDGRGAAHYFDLRHANQAIAACGTEVLADTVDVDPKGSARLCGRCLATEADRA